jgi:hypothetical protein
MNCTEIKKLIKNEYQIETVIHEKLMAHAQLCDKCRKELAMQRLTSALLKAYTSREKEEAGESPYLMARIRARIRELGEQGVGSWESAILALRGWIFAVGATAILLLTISVQSKHSNAPGSIDPVDDATSLTDISEDFISSVR